MSHNQQQSLIDHSLHLQIGQIGSPNQNHSYSWNIKDFGIDFIWVTNIRFEGMRKGTYEAESSLVLKMVIVVQLFEVRVTLRIRMMRRGHRINIMQLMIIHEQKRKKEKHD